MPLALLRIAPALRLLIRSAIRLALAAKDPDECFLRVKPRAPLLVSETIENVAICGKGAYRLMLRGDTGCVGLHG
jgi:hypothetical protein